MKRRNSEVRRELFSDLVRLGWPVLVAQIAMMLYAVVDTVMAGRYSELDLAAVGIGASIYITVFITLMGVLIALTPIVSHLFGAGRDADIGEQVRQTFWLGLGLAVIPMLVLNYPEPFFLITQAAPEVEQKAREYLRVIAWGVPASLLFRVFHGFATAVSRPRVVMMLNLCGFAIKLPLTWIFMYGEFGFPEMGGTGCALATTIASWSTCIAAWTICHRDPSYRRFGVFERWSWPSWPHLRHLLGVGVPIGVTFLVDVTAFTFMTLFIARLGTTTSAAHQISANFAALLFMLPLALGNAASVLVGQSLGANDPARARQAGIVGLGTAVAFGIGFSLLLFALRDGVAGLYTNSAEVRMIAGSLLGLVACYHIVDAIQAVAINVLRGYKRTVIPMLIYTVSLWGVGLGGGYWLGLTAAGRAEWTFAGLGNPLGAAGFWVAAIASLVCASGLVIGYFLRVSRAAARAPATRSPDSGRA